MQEGRPATATPDAVASGWVDRAPVAIQPYLRLSRLDRPIGTWLLYWPCAWGITAALLPQLADAFTATAPELIGWLLLFGLGALAMRGAGCTYNDIVDRKIDAQVARTRARPLPSGQVSLRQAWMWIAAQCCVGLLVLTRLNQAAALLALASMLLVLAYPFMKRFTWWPQAWLGLTFNWGALVGWVAITGSVGLPALLLYAAGFAWTLGYDTLYALQDVEDDALVGVKSSARRLGDAAPAGIGLFYAFSAGLAGAALWQLAPGPGWQGAALTLPFVLTLGWQVAALPARNAPDSAGRLLVLFRANRLSGLLLWLGIAALGIRLGAG